MPCSVLVAPVCIWRLLATLSQSRLVQLVIMLTNIAHLFFQVIEHLVTPQKVKQGLQWVRTFLFANS